MNKILFVVGPTATGKTALAVELAQKFDGEILSADSRQVYRHMDIGTGKDLSEYKNIKYWGIDLIDPDYSFNVSEYRKYAISAIEDIFSRNKLPIVVGGTGLYVKSLIDPWETMDVPPNNQLRQELFSHTVGQLQEELKKTNLKKWEAMNESDQKNPRRLVRAIEVTRECHPASGRDLHNRFRVTPGMTVIIGLSAPFEYLYKKIDERVEKRLKQGMEKEREYLKKFTKLPKTLGYNGETVSEWKFAEHEYARKQMTYFRKLKNINWFDITDKNWHDDIISLCCRQNLILS